MLHNIVYCQKKNKKNRAFRRFWRQGAVAILKTFQPKALKPPYIVKPVAPVAYQVILEPGIGRFREFESPRVHTRIIS